jgi:hypothetical protein
VSFVWAALYNLPSLRIRKQEVLPGVLGTVFDISMIVPLIYFPAVACSKLYDLWSTIACEYRQDPGDHCLPIYSKILNAEIEGLACAYLIA